MYCRFDCACKKTVKGIDYVFVFQGYWFSLYLRVFCWIWNRSDSVVFFGFHFNARTSRNAWKYHRVIRSRKSNKDWQYNGQKKTYKGTNDDLQTIHIKLKIEQHEHHWKPRVNSNAPEGAVITFVQLHVPCTRTISTTYRHSWDTPWRRY